VFGTVMSIKKVFFVVLFVKVMSDRLESIVFSVIMLRFQYSFYYYYYYYYYYYKLHETKRQQNQSNFLL
jgi:hypothetical protein